MLLSAAIWIPVLAGVLVLWAGERSALTRWIALAGAILGLAVTIPLWTHFDVTTSAMQFVELKPWIQRFSINYHLGVDGISLIFILLNSFITILVVIAGWTVIETRVSQYFAAFLIMSGLLNGVFSQGMVAAELLAHANCTAAMPRDERAECGVVTTTCRFDEQAVGLATMLLHCSAE